MATEIRVPTLGESVAEATIGKWLKSAGDAVAVDEPLVELETDKVSVEVPSPVAGVLAAIDAKEGDTVLTLKELAPVRLIKNKFYQQVAQLYQTSPSPEQLKQLLGRARAKRGMFEGDLEDGELEIGQISGLIHDIKPAGQIVSEMIAEYNLAKKEVGLLPDL